MEDHSGLHLATSHTFREEDDTICHLHLVAQWHRSALYLPVQPTLCPGEVCIRKSSVLLRHVGGVAFLHGPVDESALRFRVKLSLEDES